MKDKDELRRVVKVLRKSLSKEQREEYNSRIKDQVIAMPEYQKADCIFCYITYKSEVDTIPIIEQAILDGKTVAVPKVHGETMDFYEIDSLTECTEGSYHILEPLTGKRIDPDNRSMTFMLVPGLAFDSKMNRVGYGMGYYDKYFNKYGADCFKRTALAYDLQIIHEVPFEHNDVKMDYVVTETKIYGK